MWRVNAKMKLGSCVHLDSWSFLFWKNSKINWEEMEPMLWIAEIQWKEVPFAFVRYTDSWFFCYLLLFMSIVAIAWCLYREISIFLLDRQQTDGGTQLLNPASSAHRVITSIIHWAYSTVNCKFCVSFLSDMTVSHCCKWTLHGVAPFHQSSRGMLFY